MSNERGFILGAILVSSVLFLVAAATVLLGALGRRESASRTRDRLVARYAAEGGLTWAMQKLWLDPGYCPPSQDPTPPLTIGGETVTVSMANCETSTHTIDSTVTY